MWRFSFTATGPQIVAFFANDPDDQNCNYDVDDTVTLVFDMPTNTPDVSDTAAINTLLSFTSCIGDEYVGNWYNSSCLIITLTSPV